MKVFTYARLSFTIIFLRASSSSTGKINNCTQSDVEYPSIMNPMVFRAVFHQKDVMISFLNSVIHSPKLSHLELHDIIEIEYRPRASKKFFELGVGAEFNIHAIDENNRKIVIVIVDIFVEFHMGSLESCVQYYGSSAVCDEHDRMVEEIRSKITDGGLFATNTTKPTLENLSNLLPNVIAIAIIPERLGKSPTPETSYIEPVVYGTIPVFGAQSLMNGVIIDLKKVTNDSERVMTDLDKWLFFFKTASNGYPFLYECTKSALDHLRKLSNDPEFMLEVRRMELREEAAYRKGFDEGRKGVAEKLIEFSDPTETIAKCCDLDKEEIEKLKIKFSKSRT